MNRIITSLGHWPAFVIILPIYFVLHGYLRFYSSVTIPQAGLLLVRYLGISAILFAIFFLYYRNFIKAGLLCLSLQSFHFFFGWMQDLLRQLAGNGLLSQYRFLLPFTGLALLFWGYWLKRTSRSFFRITVYLNTLLFLFIGFDSWRLLSTPYPFSPKIKSPYWNALADTTRNRPDIYLLVPDQYAGNSALKEVFHFDNSAFLAKLQGRGFFIPAKSNSNYNLSPFSMASTLNMQYLGDEMGAKHHLNVSYSYELIRNNEVTRLLQSLGYRFYNYSLFDFPGQPAKRYESFLPYGAKLITMQTLTGRLQRDIRSAALEGKLPFSSFRKKIAYENLDYNDSIFSMTRAISQSADVRPKFVYAHFMLPHFPYYYDRNGRGQSLDKIANIHRTDANDYIEYLQYGNNRLLELVDELINTSRRPLIIVILSDHGFRHPSGLVDRAFDFSNLNALYVPGQRFESWPQDLTNVNEFRVLFNRCFGQGFPLLKDSTIDLWDQEPLFSEGNPDDHKSE